MPREELGVGRNDHALNLALEPLAEFLLPFVQLGRLVQRLDLLERVVEPHEAVLGLALLVAALEGRDAGLDPTRDATLVDPGVEESRDEWGPDLEACSSSE